MTMNIRAAAILFLLMIQSLLLAQEVEFGASINADKIGRDDLLVYTLTIKGLRNPSPPDISDITDFETVSTSTSTEFRIINNQTSYFFNYIYYLRPRRTGTLNIPAAAFEYNGRQYRSQSFTVEVVEGSVAPPTSAQRRRSPFDFDDDFFSSPFERARRREIDVRLDAQVSKKRVVKGEQIIYKVLLYTRNRIESVNLVSNQSFPGFWQEWYPVPRSIEGRSQQIDGKIYQVYEIRKAALFPNKTGTVTIPSLRFELGLVDSAFSVFSIPDKIVRSTPEVGIQVEELPPSAGGLPVGNFNFSVDADREKIDINDILTLRVKIRGTGNIKTLTPPELASGDDFKVFPAKISRSFNFDREPLSGVVEAEIPVSFKKAGTIFLPSLTFAYFDPRQNTTAQTGSRPLMIRVTGQKEKQAEAVTLPRTEIIKAGEDIDFIKKGRISDQQNGFHRSTVFWLLLILPFGLNILFLLKNLVFDRFISHSPLLYRKKLLNQTIKQLHRIKEYGEITGILENYLSKRTGLGFSAITNQAIEEIFDRSRIGDRERRLFLRIKSESESTKFSPQKKSAQESRRDVQSLIDVLKKIDGKLP